MSCRERPPLPQIEFMNEQPDTIAQLAISMPSSLSTLERLGIDYCCNGQRSIAAACRDAGVTRHELMLLVSEHAPARNEPSFDDKSLTEIVRYILDTHHVYTRDAMTALPALGSKVRERHGANHHELLQLDILVRQLADDLFPHMEKEEQVLFPYIVALDADESPSSCFGSARNPVRMMMLEHEAVGDLLRDIRRVTNNFALPDDACTSYRALFAGLEDFEHDVHRHIHIENNILFPRAIEAEERMLVMV